jgi:hypothetical protein
MARLLKALFGILLILSAVMMYYSLAGASDSNSVTIYHIDATDPSSSWLDVTITLRPSPRPYVDLMLHSRRPLGRNRVKDFTASRGGRDLPTWQTFPGYPDIQRIWTGFSGEPVTVRYRAHGQWRKDGTRMDSYLGPEYGYLRGMVILYTPVTIQELILPGKPAAGSEIGRSMVGFSLPPGWQLVSPLDIEHLEVQTAVLRDVYFTVGPLSPEEIQVGSDTLQIGMWQGLDSEERLRLRAAIPLLYQAIKESTGIQPSANTCFRVITILPAQPILGNVYGSGSLVVQNDLPGLARAMFLWWNGGTLRGASDAAWLQEGFSSYYQARLLMESELWSEDEFYDALQQHENSLWPQSGPQPVNLAEASRQWVRDGNPQAGILINHGGALLAYQIDQVLHEQGSSLDALWLALAASEQPVDTGVILDALQTLGGSELRATAHAIVYGQAALLPATQP